MSMDTLPAEIILHITSYLPTRSLLCLAEVCKRLNRITSENDLWRRRCHADSRWFAIGWLGEFIGPRRTTWTREERQEAERASSRDFAIRELAGRLINRHTDVEEGPPIVSMASFSSRLGCGTRADLRSWDPTTPGEKVNWRAEYIARHGHMALQWLNSPEETYYGKPEKLEIRGLGLLNDQCIVAPLDDGGIAFWDVEADSESYGCVKARSESGLLACANGVFGKELTNGAFRATVTNRLPFNGTVECVSIDSAREKGYFAHASHLHEIDLRTCQVTGFDHYPEHISVLSKAEDMVPLTIGTTQTLHLHDPRVGRNSKAPGSPILEYAKPAGLHIEGSTNPYAAFGSQCAMLSQPLPLSILHSDPYMIHVAGRFPSILNYDRRFFPQVQSSIYSGARLSSVVSIPASTGDDGIRLAVAGEYGGRGSLEIYSFSPKHAPLDPSYPSTSPRNIPLPAIQNRTTASTSKCLSLCAHGTRLLFSDGDGSLKMVERDATTLVRKRHPKTPPDVVRYTPSPSPPRPNHVPSPSFPSSTFSHSQSQLLKDQTQLNGAGATTTTTALNDAARRVFLAESGLSNRMRDADMETDMVARKLLPISPCHSNMDESAKCPVAIWTGERLGILSFGSRPGSGGRPTLHRDDGTWRWRHGHGHGHVTNNKNRKKKKRQQMARARAGPSRPVYTIETGYDIGNGHDDENGSDDDDDDDEQAQEQEQEREADQAELYQQMMRRQFERQIDQARFVSGLGLGRRRR